MLNDEQSDENQEKWSGLEQRLVIFSQKTTRRSFFGKAAAVTLGLAGVAVVERVMPRPNRVELAEASHLGCDDTGATAWYWCGVCGIRCQLCGGSVSNCPSGKVKGTSSWSCCCYNDNNQPRTVRYKDCCGHSDAICSEPRACEKCAGCTDHTGPTPWCPGGEPDYYCTVAEITGLSCTPGCC